MSSLQRIAWLAAVLPGLIASFHASAGESPPGWQHTVFVYGMGAAIEGTAQIGNVKVDVDRYDLTEPGAAGRNERLVLMKDRPQRTHCREAQETSSQAGCTAADGPGD